MTFRKLTKLGRFQVHLSTCVVLMVVAGVLIWANFEPITVFSDEKPVSPLTHSFGWPFFAKHFVEGSKGEVSDWDIKSVAANLVSCSMILFTIGCILEIPVRWRSVRIEGAVAAPSINVKRFLGFYWVKLLMILALICFIGILNCKPNEHLEVFVDNTFTMSFYEVEYGYPFTVAESVWMENERKSQNVNSGEKPPTLAGVRDGVTISLTVLAQGGEARCPQGMSGLTKFLPHPNEMPIDNWDFRGVVLNFGVIWGFGTLLSIMLEVLLYRRGRLNLTL